LGIDVEDFVGGCASISSSRIEANRSEAKLVPPLGGASGASAGKSSSSPAGCDEEANGSAFVAVSKPSIGDDGILKSSESGVDDADEAGNGGG
jgi:hypothetical protein